MQTTFVLLEIKTLIISTLEVITSVISAISIAIAAVFAYVQYKKSNQNSEMDLYFRLTEEITSESSTLMSSCILENSLLIDIDRNGVPYLYYVDDDTNTIEIVSLDLLDTIESICLFHQHRMISTETVFAGFGAVINNVFACRVIQEFITQLRICRNDNNLYSGLELIHNAINGLG